MSDYPELIYLDQDTENDLIQYLDTELFQHMTERGKWLDDLIRQQHSYWAEPSDAMNDYPFQGASNMTVPLNAIAVENIHSKNMGAVFGIEQLVSAKALSPIWQDTAHPLEQFLNQELMYNVKVKKPVTNASLEFTKFGTTVLKTGYEKIVKTIIKKVDGKSIEKDITIREGATLHATPIAQFWMPYAYQDEQRAAWVGESHARTPFEIQQLENDGLFYPGTYTAIIPQVSTEGSLEERKFERSQEILERRETVIPVKVDFFEIWMSWNTTGDKKGKQKEIIVHYHRDQKKIMAIRYNWYDDARRPYRSGVYIPVEHRWAGLGVCKQNDQFQEEVTTRTRQQLDNATLANVRMVKISKQTQYGANEPIFPGKLWFIDEMDQVDTMQLGEIYPSAYNTVSTALNFSQQRTGIGSLQMGQEGVGTPGTASDVLSRVQESNKKFDYIFGNFRELLQTSFLDIVATIRQFGPSRVEYYDTVENGNLVKNFFQMPVDQIVGNLLIDLKGASTTNSKLSDRQAFLNITQVYQQYLTSEISIAEQTQDKAMMMELSQLARVGGTELIRQFLESYDIRNIDRMVLSQQQSNPANNVQSNQPGGDTGTPQSITAPGIASTSPINPSLAGINL